MEKIYLREDYIKLGQALKLSGMVSSGVEAKIVIFEGKVKVNGEAEIRRGRKIREGDRIEYEGNEILVCR